VKSVICYIHLIIIKGNFMQSMRLEDLVPLDLLQKLYVDQLSLVLKLINWLKFLKSDSHTADQFPRLLWNLKVYCSVNKNQPTQHLRRL
jgi:hypothetical protein